MLGGVGRMAAEHVAVAQRPAASVILIFDPRQSSRMLGLHKRGRLQREIFWRETCTNSSLRSEICKVRVSPAKMVPIPMPPIA